MGCWRSYSNVGSYEAKLAKKDEAVNSLERSPLFWSLQQSCFSGQAPSGRWRKVLVSETICAIAWLSSTFMSAKLQRKDAKFKSLTKVLKLKHLCDFGHFKTQKGVPTPGFILLIRYCKISCLVVSSTPHNKREKVDIGKSYRPKVERILLKAAEHQQFEWDVEKVVTLELSRPQQSSQGFPDGIFTHHLFHDRRKRFRTGAT